MDGARVRRSWRVPRSPRRADRVARHAARAGRHGARSRLWRRRARGGAACARSRISRRGLDSGDGGAGPTPPRGARRRRARRPERLRAGRSRGCNHRLPCDLLRPRPTSVLRARRDVHGEEARLRPQPAPVPRATTCSTSSPPLASRRSSCVRSSCRRPSTCPPSPSGLRPHWSVPVRSPDSRCDSGSRTSSPRYAAVGASRPGTAAGSRRRRPHRVRGGRCARDRPRSGRRSERPPPRFARARSVRRA